MNDDVLINVAVLDREERFRQRREREGDFFDLADDPEPAEDGLVDFDGEPIERKILSNVATSASCTAKAPRQTHLWYSVTACSIHRRIRRLEIVVEGKNIS